MVHADAAGIAQRFVPEGNVKAIDFFAGGGGGSLGLKQAGFEVLAALNHNETAINTHGVNFPATKHYLADIFKQRPEELPRGARVGWFSPSCVFHSIARGGRSCNEQERAHAEQMPRFCFDLQLEVVFIENVREYVDWGPLTEKRDKNGNIVREWNKETQEWDIPMVPDKKRKGEYYRDWLRTMKSMGYVNYEYRLLNSADYGTPQSRLRYFGIFTRGLPIVWPNPTHDKQGRHGLPAWRGVRDCLQLQDKGRSIFNRTKTSKKKGTRPDPLADNSLKRILAGLEMLVKGAVGEESFLTHYYSGGGQLSPLCAPCPTVLTNPHARVVTAQFLYQNNGTRKNDRESRSVRPLCATAPTVTSNGGNQFLMTYYRQGGFRLLHQPSATVTTKDRIAKIEAEGFLFSQQFSNCPRLLRQPARTIVASRRHQYLVQVACSGPAHLQPQPGDSAAMLALKAFCLRHGITDVFMRMLHVEELKLIMGFPANYQLLGSKTEQKKMLGNAVVPDVAAALAAAMAPVLEQWRGKRLPKLRRGVMLRYEQGNLFKEAA